MIKITESGIEEGKVVINRNPLIKMLTHVFRFGSDILEHNQEVFGVCLGKYKPNENIMEVIDVQPILHGDEVEIGFSQEIHSLLNNLKQKYGNEENKMIGWYLSHLGKEYDIDFSNADKYNQTYFQTEENPFGFCIVIDNSLIKSKENFGIKVYRLTKPSKGANSDYIEVNFSLEKPTSLDYFKWVQKFVEEGQKEDPSIINEWVELNKPKPEELQEIPAPEQVSEIIEETTELPQPKGLFDGISEGSLKFNEVVINSFRAQFEKWMNEVKNGALGGVEKIRSTINQMNNTVLVGLEDVDRFFENSFNKKTSLFEYDAKKDFKNTFKAQEEIEKQLTESLNEFSGDFKLSLMNNVDEIKNNLNEKVSNLEVRLHNLIQVNSNFKTQIEIIKNEINSSFKGADELSEELLSSIETSSNQFEKNIKLEIDNLDLNTEETLARNREIEDLIDRLQKVIAAFRQLK